MDSKVSIYSSCACNRTPKSLNWGINGLICYCACNAVHLISYKKNLGGKLFQSLIGHKKLVTSVRWIQQFNDVPEDELISTSADNTAIIWTAKEKKFYCSHILSGHTNVVKISSAAYLKNGNLLISTASADSSVKIWERADTLQCKQTISMGNGFALDLKFWAINADELILFLASDDMKIHIYIPENEGLFTPALTLQGHEDWIQSLDVIKHDSTTFLASASQDTYIRIWKIIPKPIGISEDNQNLKVDEFTFTLSSGSAYSIFLDSVLSGHENWIYSIQWKKNTSSGQPLQLLSTSMDKTMIIWEPDPKLNIWFEKIRVGEVGGNTLGFYGGVFSPCGEVIIAHGFQGAIHVWQHNQDSDCWQPGVSFGGHFESVQDIDWEPNGEYLLSCSFDQTTRLHAPFVTEDSESSWHEMARPQVHGYDMACLTMIDRLKFVSAGDEKVLRVFQAPKSFVENLNNLSDIDLSPGETHCMPEGASVPSLGLSNKAVFQDDLERVDFSQYKHPKDMFPNFYYTPRILKAPPTEETLLQNTLWPEVQKLYSHPYEVFTVAANHARTLVASACKASKLEHACIVLWSTSNWKEVGKLLAHNLTVTQMEFSPDDQCLLSVSRDRTWVIYHYFPSETPPYRKVAQLDKKSGVHSRIIWSCSWTFDSLYFVTGSRDQKVAVWSRDETKLCLQPVEVEFAATAVSSAPCFTADKKYILAIGLENGSILIGTWCSNNGWHKGCRLNTDIAHHLSVTRLRFSPVPGEAGSKDRNADIVQLASCSSDNHVKIYNIIPSLL